MLNILIILNTAASLLLVVHGGTIEYYSPQHDGPVNYKLHDLYKDGIRIENKSAISFQVKCEKNAYILLQERKNDYKTLAAEVIFGSFGISISDKQSGNFIWCYVPHVLSKYEYRQFWISWQNNVIRVGRGSISSSKSNECQETVMCAINFISIGTAWNTSGYWKFNIGISSSSVSPVIARNQTLTSYIRNTTSNPNEKHEKDLTAVYIAVPIVIVVVLIVVMVTLLYRRYRGIHIFDKIERNVYNSNTFATKKMKSVQLGIENPTYIEHVIENPECLDHDRSDMPTETDDNYSKIDEMTEQAIALPKESTNDNTESPSGQLADDINTDELPGLTDDNYSKIDEMTEQAIALPKESPNDNTESPSGELSDDINTDELPGLTDDNYSKIGATTEQVIVLPKESTNDNSEPQSVQRFDDSHTDELPSLTDDKYSKSDAMEEKAIAMPKKKTIENTEPSAGQLSDDTHIYNKLSHTEDEYDLPFKRVVCEENDLTYSHLENVHGTY